MNKNQDPALAALHIIDRAQFQALLDTLSSRQYRIFGPSVRESAVTCQEISTVEELPVGWGDEQSGGHYRLVKSDRPALFDYVVGPHSWKKILYPSLLKIWSARKSGRSFGIQASPETSIPKLALLGVRPCELKALAIHDQILMQGDFQDPNYRRLRAEAFVVAVNCARPSGTCFCTSMGTGPKAKEGFDLALTEIFIDGRHSFTIEAGSEQGRDVLDSLPVRPASEAERSAARQVVERAIGSMRPRLETTGLKERLYARFDSPQWEAVAERCLTCGNCTMVCPTCFCANVIDSTDLTGQQADRDRYWESCFTVDFSYIHGGAIRTTDRARYRQWLMHKLAYWQDQFGVIGCVGCGRCITWCPVGIDIAQEATTVVE